MDDSLNTVTIVVVTAVIAFIVVKFAAALGPKDSECPPPDGPKPMRVKWGSIFIRRTEFIEENIHGEIQPDRK